VTSLPPSFSSRLPAPQSPPITPESDLIGIAAEMDVTRLRQTVKTLQFWWFMTHVGVLVGFVLFVPSLLGLTSPSFFYGLSLKSAMAGFAIILYLQYPVKSLFCSPHHGDLSILLLLLPFHFSSS